MEITNEKLQQELAEIINEMNSDRHGQLEECENILGIITLPNGQDVQVSLRVSREID